MGKRGKTYIMQDLVSCLSILSDGSVVYCCISFCFFGPRLPCTLAPTTGTRGMCRAYACMDVLS